MIYIWGLNADFLHYFLAYGWMLMSSHFQFICVSPNVMSPGREAFGRFCGHEHRASGRGFSALGRNEEGISLYHGKTTRGRPSANQEGALIRNQSGHCLRLKTSQTSELQQINSCCLSHPVYGVFVIAVQNNKDNSQGTSTHRVVILFLFAYLQ